MDISAVKGNMICVAIAFMFCLMVPVKGLPCMVCLPDPDTQPNMTECVQYEKNCSTGEACFLDRTVKPDLSSTVTVGCRSQQVCNLLSSFGKRHLYKENNREKKDLIACSECCTSQPDASGTPCNAKLCGFNLTRTDKTCAMCDRVEYPTLCQTFASCKSNEACYQKEFYYHGKLYFQLGCRRKTLCDTELKHYKDTQQGKRAAVTTCMSCCDDHRCNLGGCPLLRLSQTCYDKAVCG